MRQFIIIAHLFIQNANALSSPITIGFPAITAWLGAAHKLQRILKASFNDILFTGVGISCHNFYLHTAKGTHDMNFSIIGTGNPLKKDGSRSSFIEEARCNIEVTLVIEYEGVERKDQQEFIQSLTKILSHKMKFAGGDIISFKDINCQYIFDENENFNQIKRFLMPGFVLINRQHLLKKEMEENNVDSIDALLSYLVVNNTSQRTEDGTIYWDQSRKNSGWIIPIPIGYQGLTPLNKTHRQRDENCEHRFAESVITLGEFIMPYRIKSPDELLWHYSYQEDKDLYLCLQQ